MQRCLRICGQSLFQHCDTSSRRTLRLTCRLACQAIDDSIRRLEWDGTNTAAATIWPHDPANVGLAFVADRWPGTVKLICHRRQWITNLRGLPPRLKSLHLHSSLQLSQHSTEQCREALIAPLASIAITLRSLKLTFNPLGYIGTRALAEALPFLHRLLSLKLTLADADLSLDLAQALSHLTCLKRLYIGSDQMLPAVSGALMGSLACLVSLESLSLPANGLQSKGGVLAAALSCLTRLSHVNLSHGHLNCQDAQQLAPVLQQVSGTLRHLDLSSNSFGADAALALSTALESCTVLCALCIGDNHVHSAGLQWLLPAIGKLRGLEHLDLEDMDMGPAAARQLASTLSRLTNLQWLSIASNNFDASSASTLAPALQSLLALCRLDASRQPWTVAGIGALLPALQHLPSLVELILGGCALGRSAAAEMASVGLPRSLTSLDLQANCLGPAGAEHLTAALLSIKPCKLQSLNVEDNGLGCCSVQRMVLLLMATVSLRELFVGANQVTPAGAADIRRLLLGRSLRVAL